MIALPSEWFKRNKKIFYGEQEKDFFSEKGY